MTGLRTGNYLVVAAILAVYALCVYFFANLYFVLSPHLYFCLASLTPSCSSLSASSSEDSLPSTVSVRPCAILRRLYFRPVPSQSALYPQTHKPSDAPLIFSVFYSVFYLYCSPGTDASRRAHRHPKVALHRPLRHRHPPPLVRLARQHFLLARWRIIRSHFGTCDVD